MPRNAEECAHRARGLVCGEGMIAPKRRQPSLLGVKKERRKCSLASVGRRVGSLHTTARRRYQRPGVPWHEPANSTPSQTSGQGRGASTTPIQSCGRPQVRLAAHVRALPPHNSARSEGVQSREQGHGDSSKCCKHQRALANTKTSTAQCEITIVTVTRTGAKRTSTVHLCR
jgi:hypothetical protein